MKACLATLTLLLTFAATGRTELPVHFNRDVRPLLTDRCFQCHGPDEHDRKAGLRLDQTGGPDGAYRTRKGSTALKPGSAAGSEVWLRISSPDPGEVMPPPDAHKKPLSPEALQTIKRWIDGGAVYDDFWSFVPPRKPVLPESADAAWNRHPVDRLVWNALRAKNRNPAPRADRRTLIRRLTLDLTGLPPRPENIVAYLADTSDRAYERLVDRLLARPQYGEHMAKYWLDLVRFADTNGMHHDHYREMSPYRDWVIGSFNNNLFYDQFLIQQLAGDLFAEPTRDQLIASGFNRLHLIIDVGTALPEESFTRNVIDRVTAVGTAFMGLTVQCAVCHDHKYDPITTRDFYQLSAFFNNIDAASETGGRRGNDFKRGLQAPYIHLPDQAQEQQLESLNRQLSELSAKIKGLQPEESKDLRKQVEASLKGLQGEKQTLERALPAAMVMKERADPRPAHILVRGAYDQPGEQVERDTPGFLPPLESAGELPTRMDLAEWFVAPANPLTARVAVNRFWQQLFGVGLVKTSEDFGAQGDWPSHPDLLDYLAVYFVESGWDIKGLMKHMVLSETYRQASDADHEQFLADPENRLLARGSRYRLEAEVIRDLVLATSGLLNPGLGGKSVKPPQPKGLWASVNMPNSYPRIYTPDTGDQIYRRSLYTFWKRGMPPPQMSILNAPTREACIARRERTNTPLQALLLMNEPEYLKAARHLAHRDLADPASTPAERLVRLYETITGYLPDAGEQETLLSTVADLQALYAGNPDLAARLSGGLSPREGSSPSELAAWTVLVNVLYNLDITKTRN